METNLSKNIKRRLGTDLMIPVRNCDTQIRDCIYNYRERKRECFIQLEAIIAGGIDGF